jgi:hypothetical protein
VNKATYRHIMKLACGYLRSVDADCRSPTAAYHNVAYAVAELCVLRTNQTPAQLAALCEREAERSPHEAALAAIDEALASDSHTWLAADATDCATEGLRYARQLVVDAEV